jgi:hypothetical protein|tara:strand:- start:1902 stop:2132 length:231 start_codon:yes stop_codon:yes gene_type:complete
MSKIKLSKKELQELNELQTQGNNLLFSLGQLESQKISIYNQIQEVQNKQQDLGIKLQENYGDGNIDIETGEFTKSE